jgi:1,4-alpha-glucan branching enzyme
LYDHIPFNSQEKQMTGVFALMLHAHIPYCRKSGVWPAGEEWLFEAMNETYIPLLKVFRSLRNDRITPRIMMGLVPVLMEQLADEYMKDRFCVYMEDKIKRARLDMDRFSGDPARLAVAGYWLDFFEDNYRVYTRDFYRDILGTLKWLQEEGVVEVLTSAATHAFLPLLEQDSAIFGQVRLGVDTYEKYFGRKPRGFWLPECAYRPPEWSERGRYVRKGIDQWLEDVGLEYFFVESVGITSASFVENRHQEIGPSTFRGYNLPSGVSVFGRNVDTGKQVWSPDLGYPGDPHYLEFHQKDPESGLNCWRVTGRPDKEIYHPGDARTRVRSHAEHFVSLLEGVFEHAEMPESRPVVVAPYDCELFGHWWHEGVAWIEEVYRVLAARDAVRCMSLGDYIDHYRTTFSTIAMGKSTWGLNSDYTVWLNPEHGWIWPYINASSREMEEILARVQPTDERGNRILRQMARELLLMQGSDWPFLLFTLQAKEYANQRFHHHHQRFRKLAWAAQDLGDISRMSDHELGQMEDVDSPWQGLDYLMFHRRQDPA